MITALYFDVKFNKDIIKERFISPGSYVLLINGKEISIDFMDSYGSVNNKGKTIHVEARGADLNYCPEMKDMTPEMLANAVIDHINIYIVDDKGNFLDGLNVISTTSMSIECDDMIIKLNLNPDMVEILSD
jgi:hypothetical protein